MLRLEFENRFVGVVLDHFGQDVIICRINESRFSVSIRINVSSQFLAGWQGLDRGQ